MYRKKNLKQNQTFPIPIFLCSKRFKIFLKYYHVQKMLAHIFSEKSFESEQEKKSFWSKTGFVG